VPASNIRKAAKGNACRVELLGNEGHVLENGKSRLTVTMELLPNRSRRAGTLISCRSTQQSSAAVTPRPGAWVDDRQIPIVRSGSQGAVPDPFTQFAMRPAGQLGVLGLWSGADGYKIMKQHAVIT